MPAIRGLEKYLEKEDLIEVRPLHELEDCWIGIDVFQWLREKGIIKHEPLHSAMGGQPITLEQQIRNQLHNFHRWKIHPVFVFNGIKYLENSRAPFSSSRSRKYAGKRKEAWRAIESENIDAAIQIFSQISGYISLGMQNEVMNIFARWNASLPIINEQEKKRANKKKNWRKYEPIAYMRCPYYASAQLSYMCSEQDMLHGVWGGCELLMFGCDMLILNINFEKHYYQVVHLDAVLHELTDGNPFLFVDMCLLSGFDSCRQFEPLMFARSGDRKHTNHYGSGKRYYEKPPMFSYAVEKVMEVGSGLKTVEMYYAPSVTSQSSHSSKFSGNAFSPQWLGLLSKNKQASALDAPPIILEDKNEGNISNEDEDMQPSPKERKNNKEKKEDVAMEKEIDIAEEEIVKPSPLNKKFNKNQQYKEKSQSKPNEGKSNKKWTSLDEMLQHMLNGGSATQKTTTTTTTTTATATTNSKTNGVHNKLSSFAEEEEEEEEEDSYHRKEKESENKLHQLSPTLSAKSKSSVGSHLMRFGDDYNNRWETSSVGSTNWSNYRELFLSTKRKILKAEVLGFHGKCTEYEPFKWAVDMVDPYDISQLWPDVNSQGDSDQKDEKKIMEQGNSKKKREEKKKDNKQEQKEEAKIPNELYCLVAVGAVSTFLPSSIIGGYVLDTTPLLDSKELEHAINELTSMRNKAIDILKVALNTPKDKSIILRRWFAPNRDVHLLFNEEFIQNFRASFFKCMSVIKQHVSTDASHFNKPVLLNTPLEILAQYNWSSEAKVEEQNVIQENAKDDTKVFDDWKITSLSHLLTALCCGLFNALGYIDTKQLLPYAIAFKDVKQFRYETLMVMEMLRNGDLNDKGMTLIDENGRESDMNTIASRKYRWKEIDQELVTKRSTMRLITRVCSMLSPDPFIRHNQSWKSKLLHELSAFNQISTAYHREIRNLLDSVLCWIYCTLNVEKTPAFLHSITNNLNKLPKEPSIVMGVIFEEFVRDFGSLNWANIKDDENNTRKENNLLNYLSHLRNKFPLFTKLPEAILCCMKFFKQICVLVQTLSSKYNVLDNNVSLQFKSAYEYLNNKSHIFDAIEAMEKIVIKQHPVIRAVLEHTIEDPFSGELMTENNGPSNSDINNTDNGDEGYESIPTSSGEEEDKAEEEQILELNGVKSTTQENHEANADHLRDMLELD